MASTRGQRIGIWIIAIVMTVGTIGGFLVIILSSNNQKVEQARYTQLKNDFNTAYTAYQAQAAAQQTQLSADSFETLNQYADRPAPFDKASVTELKTEDLVVGDGEDITADSTFYAFYIGWNPDGKVFDSSIDGDKLKAPFEAKPGGVIQGWTEGVTGMKRGGIRELTIPADKAYGSTGQGADIPADTPLKFILYIPKYDTINTPVPSQELLDLYTKYQ